MGFNSKRFDDPLCQANGVAVTTDYDIFFELQKAAGLVQEGQDRAYNPGFGLERVLRTNFAGQKSGHGGDAPINWQRGRRGNVIDYCLEDVRQTKRVLDKIIQDGWVWDPRDKHENSRLMMRRPLWNAN